MIIKKYINIHEMYDAVVISHLEYEQEIKKIIYQTQISTNV